MTDIAKTLLCGVGLLFAAGCRVATRISEMPRVDQQLEGGNRGYLVGTPPEAQEMKPTRQMVTTDIEIPSFYKKPKRTGAPITSEEVAAPEREPELATAAPSPQVFDTYTVQQGDTLWSIAAKPEGYGKASRWRELYDANRDQLSSPNGIRTGMILKIPRGTDGGDEETLYEDEGVTYKK